MRDYFLTLLIAAVAGALVSIAAGGRYEKQMRYLISLICVLTVLMPLGGAVSGFLKSDIEPMETSNVSGSDHKWILDRSVAEVEATIAEAAKYKFGITVRDVELVILQEEGVITVTGMIITLLPTQAELADEISDYFRQLLAVDTEVVIYEGR